MDVKRRVERREGTCRCFRVGGMFDLSEYVVISLSLINTVMMKQDVKKRSTKTFTHVPRVFAEIGKTIGPFIICTG